uniref:WHIM1 domain-containing protein n=1 Tax=Arundo donax TaxID=35708 RepID=A0A0A9GGG1_ARUDO
MTKMEELSSNITTVRRGYYGLIDTDIKLKILRELVEEAITTSAIREILSERVDQKHALAATKRERVPERRKKIKPQTLKLL